LYNLILDFCFNLDEAVIIEFLYYFVNRKIFENDYEEKLQFPLKKVKKFQVFKHIGSPSRLHFLVFLHKFYIFTPEVC